MNTCNFVFCTAELQALGSGALWWPDAGILVVSDLHLGKSDRIARRGGAFLPPYETADTLQKLTKDIAETTPQTVISLGDSFDDDQGESSLAPEHAAQIERWTQALDWVWISGNHDPAPKALGGRCADEVLKNGITFRHIASDERGPGGEISGHFHPKLRLQTRAGVISRPAFVWDATRLILPAYGTFTGGLDITHPEIKSRLDPSEANAILTGVTPIAVPAYRAAATALRSRSPKAPRLRHPHGSSD